MKTLKAIPYQSGYIFVELDVLLKNGDIANAPYGNGLYTYSSKDEGNGKGDKVIAQTTNLNLEGIPYVEIGKTVTKDNGHKCKECGSKVSLGKKCKKGCSMKPGNLIIDVVTYVELEEDIKRLSYEATKKQLIRIFGSESKEEIEDDIQKRRYYFELGYKAAQPKQYTDEDMVKFCEYFINGNTNMIWDALGKFKQQIKPRIESFEVETNRARFPKGDDGWEDVHEYATYQKDGKTFLKVTKINQQ